MKDYEVTKVQVEGTFKVCPSCGYEDGFHAMFEGIGTSGDGVCRWLLICPGCSMVFDIGLRARVAT